MQEGHLRSKTLKNIVQTRDVPAKIETRNFGNENVSWYISVNEIEFTFTILRPARFFSNCPGFDELKLKGVLIFIAEKLSLIFIS